MNSHQARLASQAAALFMASAIFLVTCLPAQGQRLPHPSALPVRRSSTPIAHTAGGSGPYVGWQACIECHQPVYNSVVDTDHAEAFTNPSFVAQGGQTNVACLVCHTVGYGRPGGFVSRSATPRLAAVQCESCHGPAANHAANPGDPSVTPKVDLAASDCGSCHTGAQQPTFDEWQTSEHATVTQPNMDPVACGRCHLGSARLAMLERKSPAQADRTMAVVCVTCHDPHAQHTYKNGLKGIIDFTNPITDTSIEITNNELGAAYTTQLRNPLASIKDYSLAPTDPFPGKYDASIGICAQCHNHRGAAWTDTDRPPHKSPQYNFLIGTVGELPTGGKPNLPATHSRLEKQCVACHMPTIEHAGPPEVPPVTSHTFKVSSYELCAPCHRDAANAQNLVTSVQQFITYDIGVVKAALDQWAATQAPPALQAKYGTRAWEYTSPGELSAGGPGPTKAEQALIPDAIKKARFNLYVVLGDGSYGVHNGPFATTLLDAAYAWVQDELNP